MKPAYLPLLLGLLLLGWSGPARGQAFIPDLEYARVGSHSLKLDLYLPAPTVHPHPLVIWIHGGGWYGGGKGEALINAAQLLVRGFALASIDYRLSTIATYPAQLEDCKAAVRWLRANAATYNFDPDRFGVTGPSAGGHLGALLGTTGGVARMEGTVGNHRQVSSRVQAVVDFFGPTDFFKLDPQHQKAGSSESVLIGKPIEEIKRNLLNPAYASWVRRVHDANPITFVTADDPPIYIMHGTQDPVVLHSQSVIFDAALRLAGVPVNFRAVPGLGHAVPQVEADAAWDFLVDVLQPSAGFYPEGMGCPGSGGTIPLLRAGAKGLPRLGAAFEMRIDLVPPGGTPVLLVGPDRKSWGGVPLPFDMGLLGYPGCSLYVAPFFYLATVQKGTSATASLAIPANPLLVGGTFRTQCLTVVPTTPYPELLFSNSGLCLIGK